MLTKSTILKNPGRGAIQYLQLEKRVAGSFPGWGDILS